ncbi:MAG: hypothetical protein ACE5HO_01090 [bacterium]
MKRMSLNEIRKKYPDEWVLLAGPETDEFLNIKTAVVIAHSPHRSEI